MSESIPLIALLALYFAALLHALRQAWRTCRLYWLACALLLAGSALLMLLAEPATPNSGEMPPGFGLGAMLAQIGIVATACGSLWPRIRQCMRRS
ncbi:hypothetical protein C2134_02340 [Chromobacterium sinusclupearum]|uniref:Uncharacterized protein n=1 Tax=Chromobacterium sinusclupearum TaxID=2077146 RepID=A0A2K4MT27_9NEIS|nr:hypothetical protein [Chromobacterium sinusclupearum]POB00259.1 hypothetical protein C2134_02340 [Chromobacterium sinusclupearum]